MATIYVRSTDGSNADDGSTWALAKLDLAGAAAIDAAGDVIYVSDNHAESTAASISITLAGTAASPVRIICGDDAAEPPTAVASAGTVTTTGTSNITLSGFAYVYGLTFNLGSSTGGPYMLVGSGSVAEKQVYESCNFQVVASGAACRLDIGSGGSTGPSCIVWNNCGVKFANASQALGVTGARFEWRGGSIISGSTANTAGLFRAPANKAKRVAHALVECVDLSNLGAASYIFDAANAPIVHGVLRNCKLPGSWTGGLVTGTIEPGARFEMWNCDSADTNYKLWIETYAGSVRDETTIVRTGGASDGTTAFAWKMVSTANAEYPVWPLVSPDLMYWQETVGGSITVTVEVVTDGVTLTNEEAWLEVEYLGTSGNPLGVVASDAKADVLASAANQTSSSVTWTTTGLSSPVKQALAVTFTPQEKGMLIARVMLAKASATVYVDPALTVA